MHQILALWAHPRSLSTAIERIVVERGDFDVIHEPFSVLYYLHEKRARGAHADFSADRPVEYASIRAEILQAAESQPVCFKDMCYHCHDHLLRDNSFLKQLTNVFLIRDPEPTLASHYAKNPNVTLEEIGYEAQADVFRRVQQLDGETPLVISAEDLLQDPSGVMRALWQRIGVADRPDALHWQAGHLPEWDRWKVWHAEVAHSTSIGAGKSAYSDTIHNHATLASFHKHHQPFFEEMYRHRNGGRQPDIT